MGLCNELSCEAGSFFCCRLNPLSVFNQWFEALFPHAGALGLCGLFHSPAVPLSFSMCECGVPGSTSRCLVGSASCSLPRPAPQSATLLGPPAVTLPRVLSAQLPISTPPTGLDGCFFFISLVVGLHTVRFSVSSGCFLFLNCCCPSFVCAWRHSVSTYASILAKSQISHPR